MSLKKYNNMEDLKRAVASNPVCSSLVDKLYKGVNDTNEAYKIASEFFDDPTQLTNILSCGSAWVALATCKVCNLKYTDSSKMAIAHASVSELISAIPASKLSGNITNGVKIEDIVRFQELGTQLNTIVDALNNSRIYPLTLANLGGSLMKGGVISEPANYGAIANMIKHNNNMLLAYGLSNKSVSGYTSAMHGGRTYDYKIGQLPEDVRTSDDLHEDDVLNTKLTSEHIGIIVKTINDQIKALNSKNKQLSLNSKTKVENVINGLIAAENEVSTLLESLTAVNTYPPDGEADLENAGSSLVNLREAIKEKTRRELKALAISEGLGRALADALGLGMQYMSGVSGTNQIQ